MFFRALETFFFIASTTNEQLRTCQSENNFSHKFIGITSDDDLIPNRKLQCRVKKNHHEKREKHLKPWRAFRDGRKLRISSESKLVNCNY